MTLRVGLTGGIAGGKSTVARLLAERGATVVDADRLVAALYEPGEPGALAVAELFGGDLLDERGAVDRARLANVVFAGAAGESGEPGEPGESSKSNGPGGPGGPGGSSENARARLERAIHPLVRERFARIATERARDPSRDPNLEPDREPAGRASGLVVLEATLLVEAGYGPDFDVVVSVEADPAKRLERAVRRGMTDEEARRRLAAQGDGEERRAGADVILANDGSLEDLERAVDALVERLRRMDDTGDTGAPGVESP